MKKIFSTFLIAFCFLVAFNGVLAGECDSGKSCYGLEGTGGTIAASGGVLQNKNIPQVVGQIIGAVLAFVGIFYFVLMVYGGFLWMTARGNDEQVKKAIELITQASIGFAIVAAAYIITKFVGDTVINSFTK